MKLSDLPGHKNHLHIIKLRVGHTLRLFDLNACGEYLFGVNLLHDPADAPDGLA